MALVFAMFVLAGCSQQAQVPTSQPLCVTSLDRSNTLEVAQDILTEMHFVIEKYDLEKGIILTRPLRGAQFFEFWRKDNAGFENKRLANMHSIMRTAELNIDEKDGQNCLTCKVDVKRISVEERPVTQVSALSNVYTGGSAGAQRLKIKGQYDWIDMGNDTALESKILQRIGGRITKLEGNG